MIQAYLRKEEKSQVKKPKLTPKGKNKEQTKPKVSRRKEIMKIREEIHKTENQKTMEKINKSKSWFFDHVNQINKPLASLPKKRRERSPNQQNKK